MNIFTVDNIQQGKTQYGSGELVERNGYAAMRISPSPFYGGSEDYGNEKFKGILRGFFEKNTRYRFDIWIDVDDVYYEAGSKQVPAGLIIVYTDNTKKQLIATGDRSNPVGWQHLVYNSIEGKTIDALAVYYYISTPAYYRYDSVIVPIGTPPRLNKDGTCQNQALIESPIKVAHMSNANSLHSNYFYEV